MLRKITWAMLFLLLVSTQVFATACDVRCDMMTSAIAQTEMTGMAHCPGMPSRPSTATRQDTAVHAATYCTSHICDNDTALIQNRTLDEIGATSLALHGYVAMQSDGALLPASALLSRFNRNRSIHNIPAFDPLISNLRI